jgi:hypothetical protein
MLVAQPAAAQDSGRFQDGRFAIGDGITYQYDGTKAASLALASYTWDDDRYELGAFRFLTGQIRKNNLLAGPNWIFEGSRRFTLIERSGVTVFAGLGGAYKNDTDRIDGSHLNFAEQLGWRTPRVANGGQIEFAIRHVSNAGLKKPNKGQDFVTVAYIF